MNKFVKHIFLFFQPAQISLCHLSQREGQWQAEGYLGLARLLLAGLEHGSPRESIRWKCADFVWQGVQTLGKSFRRWRLHILHSSLQSHAALLWPLGTFGKLERLALWKFILEAEEHEHFDKGSLQANPTGNVRRLRTEGTPKVNN